MKLLCDEMLKGLARWLRAAGYDTGLAADGTPDRDILRQAMDEQRVLLTRDRKLLEHRHAADCVCLLEANNIDELVCELNRRLVIDWQACPFTRCMECNSPIEPAPPGMQGRLLDDTRSFLARTGSPLMWCRHCDKLYWEGDHVKRMQEKLAGFNRMCREQSGIQTD